MEDVIYLVYHAECGDEPVKLFDDFEKAYDFMLEHGCCGISKVEQIIDAEKGTFTYSDPELVEGYIPEGDYFDSLEEELEGISLEDNN